MTRGLRVQVDAGMGTGTPKTTRGLPVPHPSLVHHVHNRVHVHVVHVYDFVRILHVSHVGL